MHRFYLTWNRFIDVVIARAAHIVAERGEAKRKLQPVYTRTRFCRPQLVPVPTALEHAVAIDPSLMPILFHPNCVQLGKSNSGAVGRRPTVRVSFRTATAMS